MPESMQQNLETLGRQQAIEIIAGVQVNSPNFKQKLEENFVSSKANKRQPLFVKCHFRAAMLQKLTTGALTKETRIWKQKKKQKAKLSR